MQGADLLQKYPEPSDDKTEAHQGQSGANPRQQGALRSQVIGEARAPAAGPELSARSEAGAVLMVKAR